MTRTVFALVLFAGVAFASGCGSKSESTPPPNLTINAAAPPESPPPAPPAPTPAAEPVAPSPKVEPPKTAWELDQTKHVIPTAPVTGRVMGVEVTPAVELEGAELTFHTTKPDAPVVRLNLAPMLVVGQPPPPVFGREWKVKADMEPGTNVPYVFLDVPGDNTYFATSGYALTLALGQLKDGKVPGMIYLCRPDEQKTVLAGTFEAVYSRAYTERPGVAEVPYIAGDVVVNNAKADAEVRVAYVAFTTGGAVLFKEMALVFDPPPLKLKLAERNDSSALARGALKGDPFRYEHVKLPPGRYLVSADVTGGPAVWKWVNVASGSALTENFTLDIDATKTGGVEVSTPLDVKGKVVVAPADDPAQPPLEANLFGAIALHVMRQQDTEIVSGKALVKHLAPGKYEVRAGDLRGTIDIVAGKTAELTLAPPKKP